MLKVARKRRYLNMKRFTLISVCIVILWSPCGTSLAISDGQSVSLPSLPIIDIQDKEQNVKDSKETIKTPKIECLDSEDIGCLDQTVYNVIKDTCPDVQPQIFLKQAPRGEKAAGNYTEVGTNMTPEKCANACCFDSDCHVSFIINTTCYLLNCIHGKYLCDPISLPDLAQNSQFSMVEVRTPRPSNFSGITCEVGADTCGSHQSCIPTNHRSRNGVCVCGNGYYFDSKTSECVIEKEMPARVVTIMPSTTTAAPPSIPLTVSVTSKNVTLPENEVSLVAYVVPQAQGDHSYSYKWSLISNPAEDTATVEGQTTDRLILTGLKEGKYVFEVLVTNSPLDKSNGSANGTIFVFPEKKPNLAPIAIISPQEQTIQLPTSSAVMDASLSTDDDKIISYKWELQKFPILYALNPSKSLNSTTLQVENLIPGNYTFKLTVEDSEHAINSTTASIYVIKEIDYPPTANPGKDIVIYLPQSEVILNGNASSDDKKIVEWEWKATGDQQKAIDMQDTHTPYLKLSHLQVGLYQFELKVTDEAGQSSIGTTHVVVKESTGSPPKADAGSDQTTVLNKQNWLVLDGSKSKSESNKITKYSWTQTRGPNNSTIFLIDDGKFANVSDLTKGEYEFQLVVTDESMLTANSSVKITVIQRVNEAPHANAGGKKRINLPIALVQIDGSASTDDVGIVNWTWTRQPESMAGGTILTNSDSSPMLQLTDLVPGKYLFKLTVKDEQGLTDEDLATLIVEEEHDKKDLIEIILQIPLPFLKESDKNKIIQQLELFLPDTKLVMHHIMHQIHSENAVLQMYGQDKSNKIVNGSLLAAKLRKKLYQDSGLQLPIYSIDTSMCLDDCSKHGACFDTDKGRECVCNAFWMENFIKRRFGNKERNCEWSKVYVGVVVSFLLTIAFVLICSFTYLCRRNCTSFKDASNVSNSVSPSRSNGKRYHSNKYTLIDDDDEEEMELQTHADDGESEDSDSDILFETSGKRKSKNINSELMVPLTSSGVRNGILKNSRRVKT